MERVTGIGGFFFRADDPEELAAWYAQHLGVGFPPESYEDDPWYQDAGPTVFAPFGRQHWESPQLGAHAWGVNFRVRDLDAIVAQLRYVGIAVEVDHESYPNGRFAQPGRPGGQRGAALGTRLSRRKRKEVRFRPGAASAGDTGRGVDADQAWGRVAGETCPPSAARPHLRARHSSSVRGRSNVPIAFTPAAQRRVVAGQIRNGGSSGSSSSGPRVGAAATCASRWRVVRCTGSLSNCGSTCLPNVSIASIATSIGIVVESIPNTTWSAPASAYALHRLRDLVGRADASRGPPSIALRRALRASGRG